MTGILGGLLGSFKSGFAEPAYQFIATATGTGASGVIDFTSIPSTYKHLQIRYAGRASTSATINLTINNITTASYVRHSLLGNGSTATSTASAASQTSISMPDSLGSGGPTTGHTAGIIDILDYTSSTKNKTIRATYGNLVGSNNLIYLTSGAIFNTTEITSVKLTASAGNFATTSRFSLYGIKG